MKILSITLLFFLLWCPKVLPAQVWDKVADIGGGFVPFGNLVIIDASTIWATNGDQIAQSQDGGDTWEKKSPEKFGHDKLRYHSLYFINENKGFLLTHGEGWNMLLETNDGGESWIRNMEWRKNQGIQYWPNEVSFFDESLGLLICNEGRILRTTDGGQQWAEVNSPVAGDSISLRSISLTTDQEAWVVGSEGCILRTHDQGQTWEKLADAANNPRLNDVVFVTPQKGWILGENGLRMETKDGGDTWAYVQGSKYGHTMSFINETIGFWGDVTIFMTLDGGENWTGVETAPQIYHAIDIVSNEQGQAFALMIYGSIYRLDQSFYPKELCAENESIRIFPNPTRDVVTLEGDIRGCTVSLLNSYGVKLWQQLMYLNTLELSLDDYAPGLYFFEITNAHTTFTKKLIIY